MNYKIRSTYILFAITIYSVTHFKFRKNITLHLRAYLSVTKFEFISSRVYLMIIHSFRYFHTLFQIYVNWDYFKPVSQMIQFINFCNVNLWIFSNKFKFLFHMRLLSIFKIFKVAISLGKSIKRNLCLRMIFEI